MHRPLRLALACALAVLGGGVSALTASAQPKPAPSCSAPECRQFDFWLGDWEVRKPDSSLAGGNLIERILDGCVLQENWTGVRGMRGKSYNMYSAADHQWHQIWVDSQGTWLALAGGLRDGKMVLAGDTPGANGAVVRNRITWQKLDDGRVRQHWETSADSGATWQDAFVGLYSRKSQPGGSR